MSGDQQGCFLLRGKFPHLSLFQHFWKDWLLAGVTAMLWASLFLGPAGEKSGLALHSSFPICFFLSHLCGGKVVVFPHRQRQERGQAACHAAYGFQACAAPAFWRRSWEVPGRSLGTLLPSPTTRCSSSPPCRCSACPKPAQARVMLGSIAGGLAPSPATNAPLCRA